MHAQLFLQLAYFALEDLNLLGLVLLHVDGDFVGDLGHAGSEAQGAAGFFNVSAFGPDISEHDGFRVTANGVPEEISQFALALGDVVPFFS